MDTKKDAAAVAAPPPVIFAATLAAGLALGRATRSDGGGSLARLLGIASIAAGGAIGGAAIGTLKLRGSNVNPYNTTTALVTDGVFRFSRNPIYVGMTSVYIGIAMCARSLPALVLLPVALALLDHAVVDPEERYLAHKFGDAYRVYSDAVPRWF
jgi:protein-S-isoprenylcysteine O-methyltransferase Ste14